MYQSVKIENKIIKNFYINASKTIFKFSNAQKKVSGREVKIGWVGSPEPDIFFISPMPIYTYIK